MSGSLLCGHFRHHFLRPFLAHHGNHLGTISWTQWTPSPLPCPPFPFPLARLSLRPLWISLPQSSSLLPTTGLGSYSEWQLASSSVQGSSVRPKERSSGFDNSGESNRALQCQLLCVSRRKNKHNAKSLDRKKFKDALIFHKQHSVETGEDQTCDPHFWSVANVQKWTFCYIVWTLNCGLTVASRAIT